MLEGFPVEHPHQADDAGADAAQAARDVQKGVRAMAAPRNRAAQNAGIKAHRGQHAKAESEGVDDDERIALRERDDAFADEARGAGQAVQDAHPQRTAAVVRVRMRMIIFDLLIMMMGTGFAMRVGMHMSVAVLVRVVQLARAQLKQRPHPQSKQRHADDAFERTGHSCGHGDLHRRFEREENRAEQQQRQAMPDRPLDAELHGLTRRWPLGDEC